MPTLYRLQVRTPIVSREMDPEQYVFRDVELTFPPFAGLEIDDFDGERFELVDVIWNESQHRFLAYTEPARADTGEDGAATAMRQLESRGWARNRRATERTEG